MRRAGGPSRIDHRPRIACRGVASRCGRLQNCRSTLRSSAAKWGRYPALAALSGQASAERHAPSQADTGPPDTGEPPGAARGDAGQAQAQPISCGTYRPTGYGAPAGHACSATASTRRPTFRVRPSPRSRPPLPRPAWTEAGALRGRPCRRAADSPRPSKTRLARSHAARCHGTDRPSGERPPRNVVRFRFALCAPAAGACRTSGPGVAEFGFRRLGTEAWVPKPEVPGLMFRARSSEPEASNLGAELDVQFRDRVARH